MVSKFVKKIELTVTVIIGDFNTPLSLTERPVDKKKFSENTGSLNNSIN